MLDDADFAKVHTQDRPAEGISFLGQKGRYLV